MGAIWYKPLELTATVSEVAGYKSGLSLSRDEIISHVPDFEDYMIREDDVLVRIRAEELEELFGDLLYALGNVSSPGVTMIGHSLLHAHGDDPELVELGQKILDLFISMFPDLERRSAPGPIDLTPVLKVAEQRWGLQGARMTLEFLEETQESIHKKPWPWVAHRRFPWADTLELKELFESEGLGFLYGKFFDQRFIDYLNHNVDSIDSIHWRKFEGLVCEFFERAGFQVEIGPGRGDDGVDARVWAPDASRDTPPALLVQCKRQKAKIQKVVVKALWADVAEENAASGMIVTTSTLSPGAKQVATARAYPIAAADRGTLLKWLVAMRSPQAGVFMGE